MRNATKKLVIAALMVSIGVLTSAASAGSEPGDAIDDMPMTYVDAEVGDTGVSYEDAVPASKGPWAGSEASDAIDDMPMMYVDAEVGNTGVSYEDAVPSVAPPASAGVEDPMALAGCTPESGRDDPHYSKNKVDVSGHGWWNQGNCSGTKAIVYNCLYEYYDDGTWRRKDCSAKEELSPRRRGGGQTNARKKCDTRPQTSWRNHVDVDVVGESDPASTPYRQEELLCRYYGPDA